MCFITKWIKVLNTYMKLFHIVGVNTRLHEMLLVLYGQEYLLETGHPVLPHVEHNHGLLSWNVAAPMLVRQLLRLNDPYQVAGVGKPVALKILAFLWCGSDNDLALFISVPPMLCHSLLLHLHSCYSSCFRHCCFLMCCFFCLSCFFLSNPVHS
jgi:hypothetical protein